MRDRLNIFGIDIVKGSVRSRSRRPMYALVRMEDQKITSESTVSMFRLFRLLSEERPDILAVDSLQEIAADQHELFFFLQGLPPQTKLVQVTGGEKKETLGKVAARFNIGFDRFDPFAEARTTARVASLGAGAEVIAFENESEVVVSRHRLPGRGGWSQNRYVRKSTALSRLKGREIEMQAFRRRVRVREKGDQGLRGVQPGGLPGLCRTGPGSGRNVPVAPMCRSGSAASVSNGSGSGPSRENPGTLSWGSIRAPPPQSLRSILTGTSCTSKARGR